MKFSSVQLSDGRWGIYSGPTLLATVSCAQICKTVLANLESGRHDAPAVDINELYKAPELSRNTQSVEHRTFTQPLAPQNAANLPGVDVSKTKTSKVNPKKANKKRARKKLVKQPTAIAYPNLAEGA